MVANSFNARGVFVFVNRTVAVAYVGLAGLVLRALVQHDNSLVSGATVMALALALAFGHFTCKEWALKASAAIFFVVGLLAIPYLFAIYEQELVPGLYTRIAQFSLICLAAAFMVLNYLFYRKLKK